MVATALPPTWAKLSERIANCTRCTYDLSGRPTDSHMALRILSQSNFTFPVSPTAIHIFNYDKYSDKLTIMGFAGASSSHCSP
jgi:hypothetical protein